MLKPDQAARVMRAQGYPRLNYTRTRIGWHVKTGNPLCTGPPAR